MRRCVRCYVKGRVQGVFFRASTQEKARSLGVDGYARNMPDGRVEVLACGEQDAVGELQAWLWEGPSSAEVTDVECEDADDEGVDGFHAR